MKRVLSMVILLVSFATGSEAATIPIGSLFFDGQFSVDDIPGVNFFTIANLTGDPAAEGFASEDFPIFSSIDFTASTLTVVADGASVSLPAGDIGPGFADSLRFPDSVQISSATFLATSNPAVFTLGDGSTWVPDSPLLSATLLPSDGRSYLTPGDFALLTIEANPQPETPDPVPEPGTALLMAGGIASLASWRTRRRRESINE